MFRFPEPCKGIDLYVFFLIWAENTTDELSVL